MTTERTGRGKRSLAGKAPTLTVRCFNTLEAVYGFQSNGAWDLVNDERPAQPQRDDLEFCLVMVKLDVEAQRPWGVARNEPEKQSEKQLVTNRRV
jgi:hypothetical protein